MEEVETFIDPSKYNCKKCNKFPNDSKLYSCFNLISENKKCGYYYCSECLSVIEKCINKECNGTKKNILENKPLSRLLSNGEMLNKCPFCQGNFQGETELKKHLEICSRASYKCKFCAFNTQNMDDFWNHMTKNHEKEFVDALDEKHFLNKSQIFKK